MMLETVMRPRVAFQEMGLPKKQFPNLWAELGTAAKQQLAFSWAQLIVRAKEEHAVEIRHDRA